MKETNITYHTRIELTDDLYDYFDEKSQKLIGLKTKKLVVESILQNITNEINKLEQ